MGVGAEGPGGCLQGIRGRGAKYFFRGRKAHQEEEILPRNEASSQLSGLM